MGLQWRWLVGGSVFLLLLSSFVVAEDLPKDAQALVEENARKVAEIQKRADDELKAAKDGLRAQLEKLQTAYTKDGKLDEAVAIRDYLRNGATAKIIPEPNPGTLSAYRSEIGREMYFDVTGSTSGTIYGGTGAVFTHDSQLSTAAVHAGILKSGEKGIVKVTIMPPQSNFKALGRNGVSSTSWSASDYECFKVESVSVGGNTAGGNTAGGNTVAGKASPENNVDKSDVRANPGTLSGYRDHVGKSFLFEVTGNTNYSVYGSDLYTDDSYLSSAAVHAGLLSDGKRGIVKVTILGPQSGFSGLSRNGVTSRGWSSWPGSYKIEAVKEPAGKLEAVKEAVKKIDGVKDALNAVDALKDALK